MTKLLENEMSVMCAKDVYSMKNELCDEKNKRTKKKRKKKKRIEPPPTTKSYNILR